MAILSSMIVKLGLDAQGLEQGLQRTSRAINKELAKVNRSLSGFNKIGGLMKNVGTQMTVGLTLPIIGAGVALTKFSTDLNASMANVAALIPGNTERVKELKEEVQRLAIETGKTTGDMAAGLFQVISAFEDSSETAKILEINARAATAGVASTLDAINLTSAVTKGYGTVNAEAVQHAADLAFITVKLGQTTFPELAAAIGMVVPVAAKMGVAQEELFAGFATLTGVTGNTSQVSTQLSAVLRAMIKPTKDMSAAVKALGFNSAESMVQQLGMVGSLQALIGTTDGSTESVGKLFGRAESLNAVFALTGSSADTFTRKLGAHQDAVGAADTAYTEVTEGVNKFGFEMNQARTKMQVFSENLGDALAPALAIALEAAKPLLAWLTDAAKWFGSLPSSVQTTVVGFAALVAAIGPVLFIGGQLITALTSIAAAYRAVMAIQFASHFTTLQGGMTGLIAKAGGGRTALLGMGKAAGLAAAAFIGWQLGKWARDNIPVMRELGDAIGAVILTIPGMTTAVLKLTGASDQLTAAQTSQEKAVKKLADRLKKEGIIVKRGTKSTKDWQKALIKAAKAVDTTAKAAQQHTRKTEDQTEAIDDSANAVRDAIEAIEDYESEIRNGQAADGFYDIRDAAEAMSITVEGVADFIVPTFASAIPGALSASSRALGQMETDIQSLGIKSIAQLTDIRDEAAALANRLRGSGDDLAENTAVFKALAAELALAKRLGIEIPAEQQATLDALKSKLDGANLGPKLKTNIETPWKNTMTAVSTAITNATQSMVGILIGTEEGSLGDAFKKLGQGVLSSFLEPAMQAFNDLISLGVKKLIGWLTGEGGLLSSLGSIGGAFGGIFSGVGGGVGQAAGGAAGAAGGAGGAAGGAGGGVAGAVGGLASTLSAVGALGSFATGLVGIFQSRAQGAFLDKIEQSTRFTAIAMIGTAGVVDTLREFLPKLKDIHGALVNELLGGGGILAEINDAIRIDMGNAIQRLDDVIRHNLLPTTEDIRALLGGAPTLAVSAPGAGVGITINISGNTFSSRDDIDELVDAISSRLNESTKI